jgi:hypothetical protein
LSQQRLFVVVHKSVSEEQLRLLFRQYPGCEYCDLKRDKLTGRSKVGDVSRVGYEGEGGGGAKQRQGAGRATS